MTLCINLLFYSDLCSITLSSLILVFALYSSIGFLPHTGCAVSCPSANEFSAIFLLHQAQTNLDHLKVLDYL